MPTILTSFIMAKKKKNHYVHKQKDVKPQEHLKVKLTKTSSPLKKKIKTTLIILIIVGVIAYLSVFFSQAAEKNENFSQCLADANATMYGASWCSACNQQKGVLGNAPSIPYVECALPNNPNGQTQECIDEGVKSYPTWKFDDGTTQVGVMSKADLSAATGCVAE